MSRTVLIHYGIKGQKWGDRRFQYEDGSLTPEGKIRYGVEGDGSYDSLTRKQKRAIKRDKKVMNRMYSDKEALSNQMAKASSSKRIAKERGQIKKEANLGEQEKVLKNRLKNLNNMSVDEYKSLEKKVRKNKAVGALLATTAAAAVAAGTTVLESKGYIDDKTASFINGAGGFIIGSAATSAIKKKNNKLISETLDK